MVKLYFSIVLLFGLCSCKTLDSKRIRVTGDTNYQQEVNKSLHTSLYTEYKHKLYEPKRENWELYLEGKVTTCYDHFGNEVKVDGITTLGIAF